MRRLPNEYMGRTILDGEGDVPSEYRNALALCYTARDTFHIRLPWEFDEIPFDDVEHALNAVDWDNDEELVTLVGDAMDSLFDVLDEIAPHGHYFGGHPDNDLILGFWKYDTDEEP